MKKVATIAASDASGGAGLEADLKTFEEYGLYGMTAVTLFTTMDSDNDWAQSLYPIEEMKTAAKRIYDRGAKNVFIKGGSKIEGQKSAVDLFYNGADFNQVESALIDTKWTHGAGCTISAAITSGLALGLDPYEAVSCAKKFLTLTLRGRFTLNKWVGPGNPSGWRKGFS